MKSRCLRFLPLILLTAFGCSSMRSTMIHRNESNTAWEGEHLLNGVPVTVKVPTHLKVMVVEHHYLDDKSKKFVPLDVPLRSVTTDFIFADRIFTVDPKRPAAGTMDSTVKFDGQYFSSIEYKAVDNTIQDITGLIKNVAKSGLIGSPTSGNLTETELDNFTQVDSSVATAVFDLDAPDLELQVGEFLARHLNGCHSCQILPPGVELPKRRPPLLEDPCVNGAMGRETMSGEYCPPY